MMTNISNSYKRGVTGFYPKLKSFWSCSHMNCCQHYMLHINLYFIYSFHQIQLKFQRISRIHQLLKKLSSEQNLIFGWILFQFEFTFEFEYQTRFSDEFTIQYISPCITCECKRVLFHIMPHHYGSHCGL